MKRYEYKNLTIEIFNETKYDFNSADNKDNYEKIYLNKDKDRFYNSVHGIKIFENEKEISSCLVVASGGGTGIHDTCSLIDDEKLLLCCSDSVFCLSLPELDLEWKTRADWATCFQVFKLEETYLIHGEIFVSRIDKSGKALWHFDAKDIFVSGGGAGIFEIHSDHILVSDWTETIYKLDFDGKLLSETLP
jgi:outer membrane protein assembly factor BamB